MLPFPRINQYGNVAPVPTVSIKELAVSTQSAASVHLLYSNGELYALGINPSGKFGTGNTTAITGAWGDIRANIISATGNTSGVRLFTSTNVCSVAVMYDGKVYAAGNLPIIFPTGLGYGFAASQTYIDVSAAFTAVNTLTIQKILAYDASPGRILIIDATNQLWAMGTNTGYALGNGLNNNNTQTLYSVPGGDNCKSVYAVTSATIITKNDGTTWQCGTWVSGNGTTGSGLLVIAGSTGTVNVTTMTKYSGPYDFAQITGSQYNTETLLTNGSMRFWGSSTWSNASGTQAIAVIPGTAVGTAIRISDTTVSTNIFSVYSTGLYGMGSNSSGSLGLGDATTTSYGAWTSARSGVLNDPGFTAIDYTKITNLCSLAGNSYFVYNNEVYTTGGTAYSIGTYSTFGCWKVMSTPRSSLYNYPTGTPLNTLTNITTSAASGSILNRYGHSAAAWGNKVLVYSGVTPANAFHDTNADLQVYDTTTNTWSTIVNTYGSTANRLYGGMAVANNKAYIYGGYTTAAAGSPSGVLYIVDLLTGTWSAGASSTAGYNPRLTSTSDGMIWAYGINNSTTLSMYNPTTNTWTTMTSAPIANAANSQITSDGTYLYMSSSAIVYKYSPAANQWFTVNTKPGSFFGPMSYNQGYVYTQSGTNAYKYDISTGNWSLVGTMAVNKSYMQAVACNGSVYFTGTNVSGSATTDNFWSITQ